MSVDSTWVLREVRRDFAASVRAGIGAWCAEEASADVVLGRPIYEYADSRCYVIIHDRGLMGRTAGATDCVAYHEMRDVIGPRLAELVCVTQSPENRVTIEISGGDVAPMGLDVPVKVYSSLFPFLSHVLTSMRA